MIKKMLTCIAGVCLLMVPMGCHQPAGGWNWEESAPVIESVTTIAARIAFAQPDVQPHQAQICEITGQIVVVLDNYNDPDATFETMRQVALDVIRDLPDDVLDANGKTITITIVDSVLNTAWIFVRTHYEDFVDQNETQAAIAVANAVAKGINVACTEVLSANTFSADDLVILDK